MSQKKAQFDEVPKKIARPLQRARAQGNPQDV